MPKEMIPLVIELANSTMERLILPIITFTNIKYLFAIDLLKKIHVMTNSISSLEIQN
jgi:hypothetical protein